MTGVPVKGFFARRRRLAVGPLLPVDRLAASAVGGRALVKAEAAGRRGPTASLYKGPTTDKQSAAEGNGMPCHRPSLGRFVRCGRQMRTKALIHAKQSKRRFHRAIGVLSRMRRFAVAGLCMAAGDVQHPLISGSVCATETPMSYARVVRPEAVGITLFCGRSDDPGKGTIANSRGDARGGSVVGATGPRSPADDGAGRNDAEFEEAPDGDEELAGEGDDHGSPGAAFGDADPLAEPDGERARGLPMEPHPGELDEGVPGAPVAGPHGEPVEPC